jgi:hypothetical protein
MMSLISVCEICVSARATRSAVVPAICVTQAVYDDRLAELDGADEHDGHHRYNHGELHGGHACCLRLPALQ